MSIRGGKISLPANNTPTHTLPVACVVLNGDVCEDGCWMKMCVGGRCVLSTFPRYRGCDAISRAVR